MNSHSGIDVSNIIQASEVFHQADKIEKREKTLGTIVQVMHRYNLSYISVILHQIIQNFDTHLTRMHSSRMRSARFDARH